MVESAKRQYTFTSIDLEMAQPSGRIIQIGACVADPTSGDIKDRLSIFVNPKERLSDFIIKLTGISQHQVDGGTNIKDAYEQLKFFHQKHGSFVNPIQWGIGDTDHLKNELVANGFDLSGWCFGRRFIDVKGMYQSYKLVNGHASLQGGLKSAMKHFGIKTVGQHHNATIDSIHTMMVFKELIERLKTKP